MIDIVPFDKKYASDFYALNIEWLTAFFYVEPFDEDVLSKPKHYIIDKGGHIFFALLHGEIVGTVALMPTTEADRFELTKMAVAPKHRGLKIGQQLVKHCIAFAESCQLKSLLLYSNTTLQNAIYIYKKHGFLEVPMEANSPYKRSDIKMLLYLKTDSAQNF